MIPTITATGRTIPPAWAVQQRSLIDTMNRAAVDFVEKYTRSDGTLIWRESWPGMDGSDDGYESFLTFPLLYMLGGSEELHSLARRLWNAVTLQFTEYGQIEREFDGYYDWMHHGESSTYFYYLAMCDPFHFTDRARALRFAGFYTGTDPGVDNWDVEHSMIRSPINGSRGPRFHMTAEDWVTHRHILANYLAPYEDIPGINSSDPMACADWNDDATFEKILELMNSRMVPGDVPLNLNATSLIANAYLYTGEEKYREWVLTYLSAWSERTRANDGIMPDNIGPSGKTGELMNGKWWGGYYGWRWPHGSMNLLEATLIAGSNATMLTGESSWLDLHRSQGDMLFNLGKDDGGTRVVPHRHGDKGWFDFRVPASRHPIHLWYMSRSPEDLARIKRWFPDRSKWYSDPATFGKAGHFYPERWFGYIHGENPDFPNQTIQDTYTCMQERLDKIDADDWSNVDSWDVHHWQNLNPVVPEGLIQMAMGTPAAVYHGGLLHASVRYFDADTKRPGLPSGVAALVSVIDENGFHLDLVNTDPLHPKKLIAQAGSFSEHKFTVATPLGGETIGVDDSHLAISLGPASRLQLKLGQDRFAGRPTYKFPEM